MVWWIGRRADRGPAVAKALAGGGEGDKVEQEERET